MARNKISLRLFSKLLRGSQKSTVSILLLSANLSCVYDEFRQVSGCQDVSVLLEGQNSVFALKLEIEDRSGSLRAFQTDLQTEDGSREKTVCFQHNVPMGSSEFADDSPR